MIRKDITITLEESHAVFLMNMLNRLSEEKAALVPPDPNVALDSLTPYPPEFSEAYYYQWDATNLRNLATTIWYALNPIPSVGEMHQAELHNLDAVDPMWSEQYEVTPDGTLMYDGGLRDGDIDEDFDGEDCCGGWVSEDF